MSGQRGNAVLALILLSATLMALGSSHAYADGDSGEYPGQRLRDNPEYNSECGACHTPYQAYFLPEQSWHQIMSSLSDHFGDNAEIDAAIRARLERYLAANAADHVRRLRSDELRQYQRNGQWAVRISDLPFIRSEHANVIRRHVEGNPQMKNISNCGVCHIRAAQGDYEDDNVSIPNYGRYRD